jgi:hypothetical protein
MKIERTSDEIIFKFPKNMNLDDLQDLTDLFEFVSLSKTNKTPQKEVDSMVKSIKKGRWEKTKKQLDA